MGTATITHCPSCGKKGMSVKLVTLRALLRVELATEVATPEQSHCESGCQAPNGYTGWRFCSAPDCDVVYFSEIDDRTFSKSQLRMQVGIKEKVGERPLCYCFGYSVASIKDELRAKGRSNALKDIRKKMKDPGCHCETSNPSGSCCLGNVTKGIKLAQEESEMSGIEQRMLSPDQCSTSRGETIAKIGTVVSAIVASSCCWLPLVLLAVGVSGAGIATAMEAYRPVFIVLTFGFLAAAFYFTYHPRTGESSGHACCAPQGIETEDCCALTTKGRLNMTALNKVMLWAVTVLAVAFLLFPHYVGALIGNGAGAAVNESMNQAVFKIEGMTCQGCAATVAQAIRGVPGVMGVEVSYEQGEAVVGTDPCCPAPKEKIRASLEQVGYSVTFVE